MSLPRFKRSAATKQRISDALIGRTPSEETRAKISASMKGHPVSDEARRKMSEAAKKRRKKTDEEVIAAAKKARLHEGFTAKRIRQWRRDMFEALRMGSRALFEDVKQSKGWRSMRKLRDPSGTVSDGVTLNRPRAGKAARVQKVR